MDKRMTSKHLSAALGTTFAVTLVASPFVNATESPFAAVQYQSGYMVAGDQAEGKCGDSKSGEGESGDSKSGEGKCGDSKSGEGESGESKSGEGKCGESKSSEGKCGS